MSRSAPVRRLAILLGSIGIIAACTDTPTAPISRSGGVAANSDTTQCGPRGWTIVNGQYVCIPD